MLSKEEIIKGLNNNYDFVREAIFNYICRLHLYTDDDINNSLIDFMKRYPESFTFIDLSDSKLNKKLIECIIEIRSHYKNYIAEYYANKTLVNNYDLISTMPYNWEEIITDEENALLYKKIKHFSKKEPEQLLDLYISKMDNLLDMDEDEITDIDYSLVKAMGIALINSPDGSLIFNSFILDLLENEDFDYYAPFLINPICETENSAFYLLVLYYFFKENLYYSTTKMCYAYLASICSEELIDKYIEKIKNIKTKNLSLNYYTLCEYLNSNRIDDFLLKELKRVPDNDIKEEILTTLLNRFNTDIIPYALEHVKSIKSYSTKCALATVLALNGYNDENSKRIIDEVGNSTIYDRLGTSEHESRLLLELHKLNLQNQSHIKEYMRLRNLHSEICTDMMNYWNETNFKFKFNNIKDSMQKSKLIKYISTKFNIDDPVGNHAFTNMFIYKNSINMNCITEDFIDKKMYDDPEKTEFLESMLHSHPGLFEVTEIIREEGYVVLRDLLTGSEYKIIDIGMSASTFIDKSYIYTRIITYNNVSFATGLSLLFDKNNKFIENWITTNKRNFDAHQEIERFFELYNHYINDKNKLVPFINDEF